MSISLVILHNRSESMAGLPKIVSSDVLLPKLISGQVNVEGLEIQTGESE